MKRPTSIRPTAYAGERRFDSPRMSSARGANGPTTKAIQNQMFADRPRTRAISTASAIEPSEAMISVHVHIQIVSAAPIYSNTEPAHDAGASAESEAAVTIIPLARNSCRKPTCLDLELFAMACMQRDGRGI
jgi:hypothetical protein